MTDDEKLRARVVDMPPPEAAIAITDRKSAEDLLREAQARTESVVARAANERLQEYEKVVEDLEEMIVVVDREYRYLIANRRS